MAINEIRAQQLAQQAFEHLTENYQDTLAWAHNVDFRNLKLKTFLWNYCWVVYASGFKVAILEERFPSLQIAFKDFDPAALSRMRSIKGVLDVFNNERKANCFLTGAQTVIGEGFSPFKRRLLKEGVQALQELPGIGPITKDHMAKNIGLADVPKADIWLKRAAKFCEASSVPELTTYISNRCGESQHIVDLAIWTYGKDGLLQNMIGQSVRT
jgi:hypothetical protein